MNPIGERSLADRLHSDRPTGPEMLGLAARAADVLADAHRRGYVHGTINATAILLSDDGEVRVAPPTSERRLGLTTIEDQRAFGHMLREALGASVPPAVDAVVERASAGLYADMGAVAAALREAEASVAMPAPEGQPSVPGRRSRAPLALAVAVVFGLGVAAAFLVGADEDDGETTSGNGSTTTVATTNSLVVEADYVEVADDSGVLSVEIPAAWQDVEGRAGGLGPRIQASTDLERFRSYDYSVPGLQFTAVDPAAHADIDPTDPDGLLDVVVGETRPTGALADVCAGERRENYDDGVFMGRIEHLSRCGGEGDVVIIVAAPASETFTVIVEVHLPGDDDVDVLRHIEETFLVTGFP